MEQRYSEVREKLGFFGGLWRLLFWSWQVLMAGWFFSYTADVAPVANNATTEWERVGAGLGIAISWGFIGFFWLAGSVILGLFVLITRPPRTIVLAEPARQQLNAATFRQNHFDEDHGPTKISRYRPYILVTTTIVSFFIIVIYANKDSANRGRAVLEQRHTEKDSDRAVIQQESSVQPLRQVRKPVITPIQRTEEILVPSDAGANHDLLDLKKRSDGLIEIVSRREGSSGVIYAKRLVDCASGKALYLGEGDTLQAMEVSKPEAEFWELCCGSISAYVAAHACHRVGSSVPSHVLE